MVEKRELKSCLHTIVFIFIFEASWHLLKLLVMCGNIIIVSVQLFLTRSHWSSFVFLQLFLDDLFAQAFYPIDENRQDILVCNFASSRKSTTYEKVEVESLLYILLFCIRRLYYCINDSSNSSSNGGTQPQQTKWCVRIHIISSRSCVI